jgi:hypothetical protein
MTINDELTDEEKAILAFLLTHFEEQGMHGALAMLRNPRTKLDDIRAVIDGYRRLYLGERN